MLGDLDGWNREDVTSTWDFDRDVSTVAARRHSRRHGDGKLVTTTDYTRARGGKAVRRSVRASCRAGAIPFVSDIELTRVPRQAAAVTRHAEALGPRRGHPTGSSGRISA